jgi:2-C-methyl-D-erythritol 4-phosphate cytidylyltransferase
MRKNPVTAVIAAAGKGSRFGADQNKVYTSILGKPVLGWTLEAFAHCEEVERIVLVGAPGETEGLLELGDTFAPGKIHAVVQGGSTRQDSIRFGLDSVSTEFVLIHDAARCCITPATIQAVISATRIYNAVSLVRPVTDTLIRRSNGEAVDREQLVAVETPQGFQTELLRRAHIMARAEGYLATDDAGLVRRLGRNVHLVESTAPNPKVTYADDLPLVELLLSRQ